MLVTIAFVTILFDWLLAFTLPVEVLSLPMY